VRPLLRQKQRAAVDEQTRIADQSHATALLLAHNPLDFPSAQGDEAMLNELKALQTTDVNGSLTLDNPDKSTIHFITDQGV